jgi:hypothetical protein
MAKSTSSSPMGGMRRGVASRMKRCRFTRSMSTLESPARLPDLAISMQVNILRAAEPPGPRSFDVVCVPPSAGRMEVTVAGKHIPWKSEGAFFIGRGVEHHIANKGKTAVDFISIRVP